MAGYADASTERVAAENGIEYAYRDVGAGDVPLVLLQHFRGNLDSWDPALIDDLAAGRRVVTFNSRGVGSTTGVTPSTIEAMAHDAIAFLESRRRAPAASGSGSPTCTRRRTAPGGLRDEAANREAEQVDLLEIHRLSPFATKTGSS
jgi:hypothetical protein